MTRQIPTLVAIRIDAVAQPHPQQQQQYQGNIRIVDTILVDPLLAARDGNLDCVVEEWTDTLLADLEVQGLVRTGKYSYTGRTQMNLLANAQLRRDVEQQIRTQLDQALLTTEMKPPDPTSATCGKDSAGAVAVAASGPVGTPAQVLTLSSSSRNLVPVRIHVRDNCHGIVVETEAFRVDPALEYQNEIAMADAIVKDMNLPIDFTPGLATAIVEQEQLPPVTNNNVPPSTIAVAWADTKQNSNAMEGLIAHQFPPPPAYQKK
eukprot:scaffold65976_cov46-Attheya_sp.AAC.1